MRRLRRIACASTVLVLLACARSARAQFTSYSTNPRNILEGNWQSCREVDGSYSERVYDHVVNGVPQFEVHLGPKREFAIFKGVQEAHRDHASPANLLKPYDLDAEGNLASHEWRIPSLKLVFRVSLAGGSRSDCESWYILLAPMTEPSH